MSNFMSKTATAIAGGGESQHKCQSSAHTVQGHKKPRFLKSLVFLAICEMEFSRCNCSIAAGFVLAWTSIGRLGLRAKLAGTGHLHPEFFHLVHGSVECLAIITLVIITIYEMVFLKVCLFNCSRVCFALDLYRQAWPPSETGRNRAFTP